jgi:hypothetical protein
MTGGADVASAWQVRHTDGGKRFFYNRVTKERTWRRPAELVVTSSASCSSGGGGSSSSSSSSSRTTTTTTARRQANDERPAAAAVPIRTAPPVTPRSPTLEPETAPPPPRVSHFDQLVGKPRASKLALFAYYSKSAEDARERSPAPSVADGEDRGRPPSDSGDTGFNMSGERNGFILDEDGYWTRTDDLENEYADVEAVSSYKQKFVIREAPVEGVVDVDPAKLREAVASLPMPVAPSASRRRSAPPTAPASSAARRSTTTLQQQAQTPPSAAMVSIRTPPIPTSAPAPARSSKLRHARGSDVTKGQADEAVAPRRQDAAGAAAVREEGAYSQGAVASESKAVMAAPSVAEPATGCESDDDEWL